MAQLASVTHSLRTLMTTDPCWVNLIGLDEWEGLGSVETERLLRQVLRIFLANHLDHHLGMPYGVCPTLKACLAKSFHLFGVFPLTLFRK